MKHLIVLLVTMVVVSTLFAQHEVAKNSTTNSDTDTTYIIHRSDTTYVITLKKPQDRRPEDPNSVTYNEEDIAKKNRIKFNKDALRPLRTAQAKKSNELRQKRIEEHNAKRNASDTIVFIDSASILDTSATIDSLR